MKKSLILAGLFIALVISLFGCSFGQVEVNPNNSTTTTIVPPTKPEATKADNFYIEEVVSNYERLLIEAINNNDFSLIENLLIPNSNLYNSQKKLIEDLNNKKIQEKLVSFYIVDIEKAEQEATYKVYVNEKIGIKYRDKQVFETQEFNWIYTVISDKDRTGLSNIEKWEKNK